MKRFIIYPYDCVNDAKQGLEIYFKFCNHERPHSSLDGKTPDEIYFDNLYALPKAVYVLTARFPFKKWEILSSYVVPPFSA